jgi:hypothetical protein
LGKQRLECLNAPSGTAYASIERYRLERNMYGMEDGEVSSQDFSPQLHLHFTLIDESDHLDELKLLIWISVICDFTAKE